MTILTLKLLLTFLLSKYEDKKGKTSSVDCENAIPRDYTNNALYLKVPAALKNATKIDLVYTINGKQYTYHIKE